MGGAAGTDASKLIERLVREARARAGAPVGSPRPGAIVPLRPAQGGVPPSPVRPGPYSQPPGSVRPSDAIRSAPTYTSLAEDERADTGGGGGGGGGLGGMFKRAKSVLGGGLTSGASSLLSFADEITGDLPEEIAGHVASTAGSIMNGYDYVEREGVQPLGGRVMMTWEGVGLEVPFSEQSRASRWGLRRPSLSRIVDAWTGVSTEEARAYYKQQPWASQFVTELMMFGGPGKAKDIKGTLKMASALVHAPINLVRFPFQYKNALRFSNELIGQAKIRAALEGTDEFTAIRKIGGEIGLIGNGLAPAPDLDTIMSATFTDDIYLKSSQWVGKIPFVGSLLRGAVIPIAPTAAKFDQFTRAGAGYNKLLEGYQTKRILDIETKLRIYGDPFDFSAAKAVTNANPREADVRAAMKSGKLPKDVGERMIKSPDLGDVAERLQFFDLTPDQENWVRWFRVLVAERKEQFIKAGGQLNELPFDIAAGEGYFPRRALSLHGVEVFGKGGAGGGGGGRAIGGAASFTKTRVHEFAAQTAESGVELLSDPYALAEVTLSGLEAATADLQLLKLIRPLGRTPSQLLPASLSITEVAPKRLIAQWAKKIDFYARQPYSRKPVFKATDPRLAAAKAEYEDLTNQIQSLARISRKKDAKGRLTAAAKQARLDIKDLRETKITPLRKTTSETSRTIVSARAAEMNRILSSRAEKAGFFGLKFGDEGVSSEGWIAIGRMDPKRFPGLQGELFPAPVIEKLDALFTSPDRVDKFLHMSNQIAGIFRTGQTTTDANFPFLQGLLLLGRNPGKWIEATALGIGSLIKPSINREYLAIQMDRYPATMERFVTFVRGLGEPEQLAGTRPSGLVPSIARGVSERIGGNIAGQTALLPGRTIGQVFKRGAGGFDTFINVAQVEWFKALEPLALAHGGYSLNELGSVIRNGTGTTSSAALGVGYTQRQAEGAFLFFAPRYTRSLFAVIFDAMHGGMRGAEARQALSGLALSGAVMYFGVAKALEQEPDFDPRSPGFMSVRIGDNFVGIGSGYRSLLKLIATSVVAGADDPRVFINPRDLNANPIVRFLRSRTSPNTSTAWDLVTGRDYIGRLTTSDPTAMAEYARGRLLPFTLESYFEANGGMADRAKYLTGSFFFGRAVPAQPSLLRDEQVAKGNYTTVDGKKINEYSSLSTAQRIDFDERHPEFSGAVRQQRLERASSFSLLDAENAKKIAALEAAADTYANSGNSPLAGRIYRNTRSNILAEYRGRYEGLRTGSGLAELEPKTTDQKILAGYFDKVIAPAVDAAGQIDFDLQEELERSYRREVLAQYGQEGLDALERDLGASGNWLEEIFRADQVALEPYWAHLDQIWIPEVLNQFGLSSAASFPSYESFRFAFLRDVSLQLEGMEVPLPLKERFPTARLSKQQSGQLAQDMFNKLTEDYSDFKTAWRNEYLMDNPDQLSRLITWSYMPNVPKDLEPYIE